jgi:hypothetical protein
MVLRLANNLHVSCRIRRCSGDMLMNSNPYLIPVRLRTTAPTFRGVCPVGREISKSTEKPIPQPSSNSANPTLTDVESAALYLAMSLAAAWDCGKANIYEIPLMPSLNGRFTRTAGASPRAHTDPVWKLLLSSAANRSAGSPNPPLN